MQDPDQGGTDPGQQSLSGSRIPLKSRGMSNSEHEERKASPGNRGFLRPKIRHDEADRLHRSFKLELDRQTHHLEEFFLLQCQMAEATLRAVEEQNRRSLKQQQQDEKKVNWVERSYIQDMSERQQEHQGNHDGQMANKIGRVVQKHLEEGPKTKTTIIDESPVQVLGPRNGSKTLMAKPPLQLPGVPEPEVQELPGQVPEGDDHDGKTAQEVDPTRGSRGSVMAEDDYSPMNNLTFADLQAQYGVVERRNKKQKNFRKASTLSKNKFRLTCQSIVAHKRFEPAMSFLLLACAAFMAVESDAAIGAALQGKTLELHAFQVLDRVFSTFFIIELALRWTADGFWFFFSLSNANIRWNCMDVLLVASGIAEDLGSLGASAGGVDMSSLRLLRMMRLVRVARILRVVRFFSELRVMVYGIMGSAKSLLWALMLLTLVMFMASVTIMQLATIHLLDLADESISSTDKPEVFIGVKDYFGDLFRAMITLYMSIAGGIDWRDAIAPFRQMAELGRVLELLVCGYVFFTVFCCLNIVTGIFVDNAKALKQADEEHMFQEALSERKRWIVEVSELFAKVDEHNAGGFTYEAFRKQLTDIRVQALFSKLGINTDTTSPEELWEILDTDNSGKIDQEEFARGMRYFQGSARSIDVYRLRKDSQSLGVELQELKTLIDHVKGVITLLCAEDGMLKTGGSRGRQTSEDQCLIITKAGDPPPECPVGAEFPRFKDKPSQPSPPSEECLV